MSHPNPLFKPYLDKNLNDLLLCYNYQQSDLFYHYDDLNSLYSLNTLKLNLDTLKFFKFTKPLHINKSALAAKLSSFNN